MVLKDAPDTGLRWFRPAKEQVRIYLLGGAPYQPDFVVETSTARFLLETKRRDQLLTDDVQTKRRAAEAWCEHASAHAATRGGKPWHYALLADDLIGPSYRQLLTVGGISVAWP